MTEKVYDIKDVKDLVALLDQDQVPSIEQMRFDGWPSVDIKIYGDRYHGDITPEMANALYEFSQSLKRAYAAYKYGIPKVSALKASDLELFSGLSFSVGEGCTGITSKLQEAFQGIVGDLAKEAIKKMDSKDIAKVVIVLGVFTIGSFAAYKGYGLYTDAKLEQAKLETQIESEQITADANKSLLEENRELVKTIIIGMPEEERHRVMMYGDQVNEGYKQVVQSASDADQIEFGGDHLGSEEIEDIVSRNSSTNEALPVTDELATIEGVTKNINRGTVSVKISTARFPDRSVTLQFIMNSLTTDANSRLYQALEHSNSKQARITYAAVINSETGEFEKGTLTHVGELVNYRASPQALSSDDVDVASK